MPCESPLVPLARDVHVGGEGQLQPAEVDLPRGEEAALKSSRQTAILQVCARVCARTRALYAKCPYYVLVVLYMQCVLII